MSVRTESRKAMAWLPLAQLSLTWTLVLGTVLAQPADGNDWSLVKHGADRFYGDVSPAELQQAASGLRQLKQFLGNALPAGTSARQPPLAFYLLRDRASLGSVPLPKLGGDSAGYAVPTTDGIYAVLDTSAATDMSRLVYKQFVLVLLAESQDELPAWLSSGIAELYSSFEAAEGRARIGLPVLAYLGFARSAPLLPMETLFYAERGDTLEEAQKVLWLGQAWTLVHYLTFDQGGAHRGSLRSYISRLRAGEPAEQTFRSTFPELASDLEGTLQRYASRDSLSHFELGLTAAAESPDKAVVLSAGAATAALADLLLQVAPERASEAGVMARQALASEGGSLLAQAVAGQAAWHDRRWVEAAQVLSEAVGPGMDSALGRARSGRLHYILGDSVLQNLGPGRPQSEEGKSELARARSALERSVELQPEDGEAWARLGFALSLEDKPLPAEAEALERARQLLPQRQDLVRNLLLAYARLGRRDGAEAMYLELQQQEAAEQTLGQARELLLQMDFSAARRQAHGGNLHDAVALYARVEAESADRILQQKASSHRQLLTKAVQHNRFAEQWLETRRLQRAGDLGAAHAALRKLAQVAQPGLQRDMVQDLLQQLTAEDGAIIPPP